MAVNYFCLSNANHWKTSTDGEGLLVASGCYGNVPVAIPDLFHTTATHCYGVVVHVSTADTGVF